VSTTVTSSKTRRGVAVAAELDCAVSTASDVLRRAESTLVTNAIDAA
jgi:predicted DNA binding protein